MSLASIIDHTVLKANATREQVERLCDEAAEHGFASVCVNSCWVAAAAERLADSPVKVCTVIGFPLGAMSTAGKVAVILGFLVCLAVSLLNLPKKEEAV